MVLIKLYYRILKIEQKLDFISLFNTTYIIVQYKTRDIKE